MPFRLSFLDTYHFPVSASTFAIGFDINLVAQNIREALDRERIAEQAIGWNMLLLPTPALKRMLIVGIGVAVAQQAVGIDAIQYYLIDVLDESGIESDKAQLGVLVLMGVLKLLFVVVGSKLFDRRGRRRLLFVSLLGTYLVHLLLYSERCRPICRILPSLSFVYYVTFRIDQVCVELSS